MSKFGKISDELERGFKDAGWCASDKNLEDYENYIEIRSSDKGEMIWEHSENAGDTADLDYEDELYWVSMQLEKYEKETGKTVKIVEKKNWAWVVEIDGKTCLVLWTWRDDRI